MSKFKRNKEDFVCEKCGQAVIGNGYTNHCPKCLWSKHVDVMPGDRAATCGGMMEPVGIEGANIEDMQIVHKCVICSHTKRNRFSKDDNFDVATAIVKKKAAALI